MCPTSAHTPRLGESSKKGGGTGDPSGTTWECLADATLMEDAGQGLAVKTKGPRPAPCMPLQPHRSWWGSTSKARRPSVAGGPAPCSRARHPCRYLLAQKPKPLPFCRPAVVGAAAALRLQRRTPTRGSAFGLYHASSVAQPDRQDTASEVAASQGMRPRTQACEAHAASVAGRASMHAQPERRGPPPRLNAENPQLLFTRKSTA